MHLIVAKFEPENETDPEKKRKRNERKMELT